MKIHKPTDYYANIVEVDLDNLTQSVTTPAFTLRHAGKHIICVYSRKFATKDYNRFLHNPISHSMIVKIEFTGENRIVYSELVQGYISPVFDKSGTGLILRFFRAPSQIPLDKELVCRITPVHADADFVSRYAPFRLTVSKTSDE